MLILISGILTLIAGLLFLRLYIQIRGDKDRYYMETNSYPLYHWKFLFKRYTVGYTLATTFILITLGMSMIIVFF